MHALSGPRKASYLLFAAALFTIARFDLGTWLLTALASYMILDLTDRRLREAGVRTAFARLWAVGAFVVMASVLFWVFFNFLRVGFQRLPILLDTVLPRLAEIFAGAGLDFPAENAREFRDLVVGAMRQNAASIGQTSGLLTRTFFQVLGGMLLACLRFVTAPASREEEHGSLFDALRVEFEDRVANFLRSFERVVGAQFTISIINTILTAAFLIAMGFPFRTFLVLTTFVFGFIPIIGNVVSNTVIVAAGLVISVKLAVAGLIYLVVIHTLEHVLNTRIIGRSIDTPMWMTLVGLVVGEALMGVPGVLIAPAIIHYVREELRAIPARPG